MGSTRRQFDSIGQATICEYGQRICSREIGWGGASRQGRERHDGADLVQILDRKVEALSCGGDSKICHWCNGLEESRYLHG